MARVLVSYWRADEITSGVTLNFWDGFFQELCNAGNDVLAINNAFYNIFSSNKTDNPELEEFIHKQVELFNPELIITFNNRILQSIVDKYSDVPVVIYDGDELRFFSDLDTIRKNIEKYKIFSLSKEFEKDYIDFGFKKNQIFYMPPGTAIHNDENAKQYMNISFLGQRRWFLSKKIYQAIAAGQDLQVFYKTYIEHIKTGNFDYLQLFHKNGGGNYNYDGSDLWPLFDDSYLVFANLLDLGLHLGGHEGHWRDIMEFIPQLAVTHDTSRIFTLKENQDFYNSSILSLSPIHPQSRGKAFSWRSFDIMASNACLISSYSSELKDLTLPSVKLPMYYSPSEAREICIDLLENKEKRDEIVKASQEYVEKNCRWRKRFEEMESILNLSLVKCGKLGKFIKLPIAIPDEENKNNVYFYNSANCKIINIHNEINKMKKIKLIILAICFIYDDYIKRIKNFKFWVFLFSLIDLLLISKLIFNHNETQFMIEKIISSCLLLLLALGTLNIFLIGIYKLLKKLRRKLKLMQNN